MFAIAFTGQDGTGKSTQMKTLRERLTGQGLSVAVVHQYEPTTWLGRTVAPLAKRFANRLMRRRDPETRSSGGPDRTVSAGGAVRRGLAWVSLSIGWTRSVGHWFRSRRSDILILDRFYSDEIVRAAHKFGRISRWGLWLMRSVVPRPDLVFTFTLDPQVGWERKKTREMTLNEYREKTRFVRGTMHEAERVWTVVTIAVDDKDPGEIFEEIWSHVEERRAAAS